MENVNKKEIAKLIASAEVYKKVISKAIQDSYAILSEEDKSKIISEKGAINMSDAFINSLMESVEKLIPLLELLGE